MNNKKQKEEPSGKFTAMLQPDWLTGKDGDWIISSIDLFQFLDPRPYFSNLVTLCIWPQP